MKRNTHYSVVKIIDADKIGSATSPLGLAKTVAVTDTVSQPEPAT